ncbi:MAG: tetratricopeptide repeat protein [Candidatus Omnitrophica bacterium]|nr:tetratricopeptide repeat protein [Candidatus Omnitrophota bacterium]
MSWKKCLPILLTLGLMGCGENPDKHFETGLENYNRKDFTIAKTYLRKALAIKPDYVPAYLLLGRIGVESGDEQAAELNYRNAYNIARERDFQLHEEDLRARDDRVGLYWQEAAYYLADLEFQSQNYNRAVALYDEILDHENSGYWLKRAFEAKEVTRDFFDYRKRLQQLRQEKYANQNDPRVNADMALLMMDMATGLTRMGKLKSVSEQVAVSKDFREQAEMALEEIYAASPDVHLPKTEAVIAYTESQELLMRGKFDEALKSAKEASEKDPENARYHFAVANILQVIDNQSESASHLDQIISYAKRAVDLEPEVWRYSIFYAGRLREIGQLEESKVYLERARRNCNEDQVLREIDETLAAIEEALAAQESGESASEASESE